MTQTHKFFIEAETTQIDLPDDEWVKIKSKLTIGDQDTLGDKLLNVELDTQGTREERRRRKQSGTFTGTARFKPSTAILLELSIISWSFKYDDGTPVPLTLSQIQKMDPDIANLIEDAIDERNPLPQSSP